MRFLAIALFGFIYFAFNVENGFTQTSLTTSLHSGTIDSQFIHLNRISRNHEGFKLIRPQNLNIIRKNIADSLTTQRNWIYETEKQLSALKQSLGELQDSLIRAEQEIQRMNSEIDYISFLGVDIKKATYHAFMWITVFTLIIILLISGIRFQRGNTIAREARQSLEDLQAEFDQHRKKSLEKEQKLKRELQDEINKRNN